MTLLDAVRRARTVPRVGDHEFVLASDGLMHLAIITLVDLNPHDPRIAWGIKCGIMVSECDLGALEIAPQLSCLKCSTW